MRGTPLTREKGEEWWAYRRMDNIIVVKLFTSRWEMSIFKTSYLIKETTGPFLAKNEKEAYNIAEARLR